MKDLATIVCISFAILLFAKPGHCGECCKKQSYFGDLQDEIWCDDYCCISLTKFVCCDDILRQAPASQREDICSAFFTAHAWIPVLIALGGLLLIVGCVVFCCKMCCRRTNNGVIFSQGLPTSVVVQNTTTTTTQSSPYSAGYDQ